MEQVRTLLLFIPPFIFSLTLHEFAHAWMADKLGDSTARYMGRLTMDPMAHISWVGTVILPALMVLTGGPLFGWANPVPVDARNFPRKPLQRMAFVAAAGPGMNIILATLCVATIAVLARSGALPDVAGGHAPGMAGAAIEMLVLAVQLNLFLAFFNLLPLPPLDGSRILQGFMSPRAAEKIDAFSGHAQILLLILFMTGGLRVLAVPVYMAFNGLFRLFGIQ